MDALQGFYVYRIDEPDQTPFPLEEDYLRNQASVFLTNRFTDAREVSARFPLPAGTYAVIPSTWEPNQEGDFLLRIFTEKGGPVP